MYSLLLSKKAYVLQKCFASNHFLHNEKVMKILLSQISVHKLRVSTKTFRVRKEQDGVVTTRIKTQ